jgi:predicted ATPase/DNA-binding SARP family transcriptional activator/DNA-binding CsgD family transcriptional regulator
VVSGTVHRRRAVRDNPEPRDPAGHATPEVVRVRLLGGFRVWVGSRAIREDRWRSRKAAGLIKLLALAPGHRLRREQAMDLLWPDLDASAAANNLHRTLYPARRTLESRAPAAGPRYLRLREGVISLCPEGTLWVDVEAFEEAAATARRTREPAAYRAAIELYAGELLPEDRYEEWTEERRGKLGQLYLALLLELAGLYEERAEYGPGIEVLRKALAEDPLNEEVHAGLMRLHALRGEQREAILGYERFCNALSRELGAEPGPAIRRLYEEVRAERLPATPSAGRRPQEPIGSSPNNLPASLTSFVGREQEVLEVKRLLSMTRLLTLTGAGGCGKTRLALEIARDLVGTYQDGAWLVELAALSRPDLVPRAVAAALGVPEQAGRPLEDILTDHLRTRDLLLLLDNCEHLVDGAARLTDILLSACPNLKVLATSREPLGVPGEAVWTVPPLSLPEAGGAPTIESLMRCEAVRLFVDRARSRLPAFELTEENAGSTARVCRKLDGIPLAIELACARMGALAVEQLARRLEDSLGLLTGGARTADPRQQTMRATLRWSHELLSGPEQELFARLSVFAGGWTLEAAEEVCQDAGQNEVLDLLSSLVNRSLVLAEERAGEEARYRMLEPVRQYALEECGDVERVRERHARYYLALAEAAEPELVGPGQLAWLERLATEYPNLQTALSWCLDGGGAQPEESAEMGLRMAAALGQFWGNRGSNEGREWLEKGLARSCAAPASLRAKALNEAGFLAILQFDARAIAMLEEALALYKELGDKTGQAVAINYLMHTVGLLGNLGRAPTIREETLALLEGPLEDQRAAAYLHMTLGMIAITEPDPEQVVAQTGEALSLFKKVGDLWSSAKCLTVIGMAALGRGDADDAARAYEAALRLLRLLKNKVGTAIALFGAGGVAVLRGKPARAARLFGAEAAVRNAIGLPTPQLKLLNYYYEDTISNLRAELGEASFEAAFSEGQAMSAEQAIEYALSSDEPTPPPKVPEQPPGGASRDVLTRREREVALLLGRKLTNRQIAEKLTVSEHTVAAHVRKILKKLGLRSRVQIPSRLQ